MSTVKAYYNGLSFVPIEPVHMQKGKVVRLSILHEEAVSQERVTLLAAFRKLTNEIIELNKTEPLPPEYDEILNSRVNFSRELSL